MKSLLLTVFSCFLIANAFSQVNLNQGLIGYFPFNGDANDRSGYNNNPTYNSGTLAPDRFGNPNQAYWFNGYSDNMTIPGSAGLNTATAMTVALYFNPENTNLATLVGKIDYTYGNGTQFQVAINWVSQPGVLFGINDPADACQSQINANSSYVNTGGSLPINQWYCLAATYDKGVQKIYLNGTLIQQRTTTFTTLKQCGNSDINIGTWWKDDQQRYKGRIDDVRIYNRALSQAEVTALCTVCSAPITDFFFKQNVCNPLSVQFTGAGGNLLDPHWDFGDGTPMETIPSPVHTYANPGNHPVKFIVQNGNCKDTITKTITVKVDEENIVLTPDTTICSGSPLQLQAKPALSYCWSPGTNLSSTTIANPVTTATQTTTYYLISEAHTNNLVVNGNFNNGATGFTSSYTYSSNGVPEGVYFVGNNPQAFHPVMPLCGDHTSGNGNMMLVNGATQANVAVWSQTVNVTPNTNYAFSTWLQHMTSLNPAKLQFSINGIPIGTIFQANNVNCIWDQFYTVWNSGNKATATISIINQNTGISGNDFALDDIEFSELKVVRDSVKVTVTPPLIHTPKQTIYICPGNSVKIGTGQKNAQYTWNTGATTDSIIVSTPGTYWVQTDRFNCTNKDTFVIVQNTPTADFTYKLDVCNPLAVQFFGVGSFTNPNWDFGDGNMASGSANAANTYPLFGNYTVKFGVESAGCKDTITKTIDINVKNADIVLTKDTIICLGASVPLQAQAALSFCWSPTTWLSNANTATPIATPQTNTTYYYTAEVPGTNLAKNGDFNNGDVDFTSEYINTSKNVGEGEYTVTATPKGWNTLLGACTDHTTGTGNMLLINGATQVNVKVWTQTIAVTPNTNYAFSAWLQNANVNGAGSNPPRLQFSINGYNIGNILQGRNQMCVWDQFYSVWNSGNNTTATISIVNQNTVAAGNDYALDDISFAELKILRDSVKITVETPLVHTPTRQITICRGDSVKIGTGIKNAQYTWNTVPPATTDSIMVHAPGTYWVQTDLGACTNKDTSVILQYVIPANFTYKQDACNPLIVQFTGVGSLTSFNWDFGDGNTSTGNLNVTHTYPVFNSYTVKFAVEENGCKDTITQTISVNVGIANLVLTPDTTICYNASKQLRTQPTLGFCWSPTTWLSDPASPNPVTTTPGNITYYFTAQAPGINLATNGDFSNGTTGFSSDYINRSPNNGEGEYTVGPSSYTWNNQMASCSDHTTGNGNMLIVNGASTANAVIWSQKINAITPNTDYAFIASLQNVNVNGAASNPATLQFSINGTPLGNVLQASNTSCVWDRFYIIWNSGSNTSANISIINQNTASAGNDFALDDISFSTLSILRDSVKISVDTPVVITRTDTIVCKNAQIELPTSGAATWAWTPAPGLSSTTISNPIATVDTDIKYIVTGTTVNGCTAKDTVNISIHPVPNLITDEKQIICPTTSVQLYANNTLTSWSWAPAAGLNNTTISNPVATPDVNTEYIVTGTTVEGCTVKDTININIYTLPTVIADRSLDICPKSTVQLTANNTLTSWSWTPAAGLSSTTISNPIATPTVNTEYIVTATTTDGCTVKDTVNVNLYNLPTVIADRSLNVCPEIPVQLLANNTLTSWLWAPATGLSSNTISNPIATPDVNTEYRVTGITADGCTVKDTININLYTIPTVLTDRYIDACLKAPLQLSANNSLRSWLWTPATNLSSTTISNPVVTPAANTEYIVTGITNDGCIVKDTIDIKLYPIPMVITNHDLTACPNTTVQLSANNAMTSWLWTPALYLNNPTIANPTVVPAKSLTYTVQVKDQYNCTHTDTVRVQRIDPKFTLQGTNRIICYGASVSLQVTGGDTYLWTPAHSLSNAAIANPVATPDTSTTYTVYAKENTCGTDSTLQVRVNVNPIPVVEASKENDINCVVHVTPLHASGTPGTSYLWRPAGSLDKPNQPNPVASPDTTTRYYVTGSNQYGCTSVDSVTVYVEAEGKVTFMVPNAFTPNGDGRNDCFGVKSWGGVTIEEFAIFNRWGQRVFITNNATACWDGRFKGEQQPSGGYVYVIKAKTLCGNIKRTGTVILVR